MRTRAEHKTFRATPATTTRACLRCDRTFASEGPHHRLCGACRELLEANPPGPEVQRVRGKIRATRGTL
jgi:hypothetical protein